MLTSLTSHMVTTLSFTHSHSLICRLTLPLTSSVPLTLHSVIHPLICPLIHPPTHSPLTPTHSPLSHPPTHSSTHSLVQPKSFNVSMHHAGMYGQLGHGDNEKQSIPKMVEALADATVYLLACGNFHTVSSNISSVRWTRWGQYKLNCFVERLSSFWRFIKYLENNYLGPSLSVRCKELGLLYIVPQCACPPSACSLTILYSCYSINYVIHTNIMYSL